MLDFGGARGSNAGDAFHELWAVRRALALIEPGTRLIGLTVEGLVAEDEVGAEPIRWAGVDCATYTADAAAGEPDSVLVEQLKYSAADPNKAWTLARFVAGKGKGAARRSGKGSVIFRLADAYRGWVDDKGRDPQSIRLALVTNQPIADDLRNALAEAANGVPQSYADKADDKASPLHKLVHASGLAPAAFETFAGRLDLQGGADPRYALEDQILQTVLAWTEGDIVETADRLRRFVANRMLPEGGRNMISAEAVMAQLGAADKGILFPCPPRLREAPNAVPRDAAIEVIRAVAAGQQRVCLHGSGGVGKTTALQQIRAGLPAGSVSVVFDCYGAGSYLDPEALRHRPADAFLQLTNELALGLGLPLLLAAGAVSDPVRAFHRRLKLASVTLAGVAPDAVLLIAVDAADNAVAAAQSRAIPESNFIHDLVKVGELPANVRLLVTARTSRLDTLELPSAFHRVLLEGFTPTETAANVARHFVTTSAWIEDFHLLSRGNPRVQAYALESGNGNLENALEALRPAGKDLDDVFRNSFAFAVKMSGGQPEALQALSAGLVSLPRPVPLADLAAVTGLPVARVQDIAQDLAPGLRLGPDAISFADEDFEAFVRVEAAPALDAVRQATADRFLANADTDPYAALNVASALFDAGRRAALLAFVERQPDPPQSVMPDPVRRSETHLRRLRLAIKVCREAGEASRALRFVLQGAEASRRDATLRQLLTEDAELSARFARDTADRLVLTDPDEMAHWGSLMLQRGAEAARVADLPAAREWRRRFGAWLDVRWDAYLQEKAKHDFARPWEIRAPDVEAMAYLRCLGDGVPSTAKWLLRIRDRRLAWQAGVGLVDRLLAEGLVALAAEVGDALPVAPAAFVRLRLASAGQVIDYAKLAKGVSLLARRKFLDVGAYAARLDAHSDNANVRFLDDYLTACELLASQLAHRDAVPGLLRPFLLAELRWCDARSTFETPLLDLISRAVALEAAIAGTDVAANQVFPERPSEVPLDPKLPAHRNSKEHNRELQEIITPAWPFYVARAKALADPANHPDLATALSPGRAGFEREFWRFSRRPDIFDLRARLAQSLPIFIALGHSANAVLALVVEVRKGWHRDHNGGFDQVVRRLSAHPVAHGDLIAGLVTTAQSLREERVGAEERMQGLLAQARLLAPFSPHDAQAVFEVAVEVAGEMDREIISQVDVIAALAARAGTEAPAASARDLADVAHDAGIRLTGRHGFPWAPAMGALARLDLAGALACVSRWDDTRVAPRDETLGPALLRGLETRQISAAEATALIVLNGSVGADVLRALAATGDVRWPEIADALAHETLRHAVALDADTLLALVGSGAPGSALAELRAQVAFNARLTASRSSREQPHFDPVKATPAPFDLSELVDAERLTAAIEARTTAARAADQFVSSTELLRMAVEATPVARRVDHLEALAGRVDAMSAYDRINSLVAALTEWSGSAAVVAWARRRLPELLAEHLTDFTRYLGFREDEKFAAVLAGSGLDDEAVETLLLEGIERHGEDMGSGWTFGIAAFVAAHLPPPEAAALLEWYAERLAQRLPASAREWPVAPTVSDPAEAVARSLYAALSDVDQRVRWQAAHGLRWLAKLGGDEALARVAARVAFRAEPLFRDTAAPFYDLAAEFWLVIALDRIAGEAPAATAGLFDLLSGIALDTQRPHLLIRAFARDAAVKLIDAGFAKDAAGLRDALGQVNRSSLPLGPRRKLSTDLRRSREKRYSFDALDMLPGWYQSGLRPFSDVSEEEFLAEAERWIIDVWGADPKRGWDGEPRAARFDQDRYDLTSVRDGSLPVVERYRTYLEWHALWCAMGELLKTRALSEEEEEEGEWGSLAYVVARGQLTLPPLWLADLTTPQPLRESLWRRAEGEVSVWLEAVGNSEFRAEIFPEDRPDHVVVHATTNLRDYGYREEVHIRSALVDPATGPALVRALQSSDYSREFYLPHEDHELEVNEAPYRLLGWLAEPYRETRIDDNDDSRNDVSGFARRPGRRLAEWKPLRLSLRGGRAVWHCDGDPEPAFIHEAWGPRMVRGRDQEREGGGLQSLGMRLLVRRDVLQAFLTAVDMDLILEVGIDRGDRRSSTYKEEGTEVAHERLHGLAADGRLYAATGDLAPWTPASA